MKNLNRIREYFYNSTLGNIIVIILAFGFLLGAISLTNKQNDTSEIGVQKISDAIKQVESEEPSRISENPTEEEVYNNEYVKNIRTGLNGYLDGTNIGVDEYAIEKSDLNEKKCGLNSFDKSYYKSKFIVVSASDNDYGGVQADIFFIDKPDTLFWAWVYRLDGDGEYELRGFCESSIPIDTKGSEFLDFVDSMIKGSENSL